MGVGTHYIYRGLVGWGYLDFGFLGWILGGFCEMKENKKSGGGDVRAKALAWDDEWDKARKLIFSFITTRAHSGLLRTPLTPLAARRKSRFAEKKSASPKKNLPVEVGVGGCVGVGIEGRAQNIAPLQVEKWL